MRKPTVFLRSAVVAGLAFAASCGSDSATSPTTSSASLQAALTQTTLGDASTYSSARDLSKVPGAAAPTFDPGACTFASTDNGFTCPTKTASGVSFQLKYYLFNSAGVAMSTYDPAITDRLRAVWDASGTFTTSGTTTSTVALNHHSDFTLTGLLGTSRVLNGGTTDRDTLVTGSGASSTTAALTANGGATNVVLPAASGQFPSSGALAADITIVTKGAVNATATSHSTLTFSGTNSAIFTVTTGGGTSSCTIDLTGAKAPVC